MNIVVPMAGRGSRFVDRGIATPKPLIDVLGRPMYAAATDCLPLHLSTRLIFICLADHLERWPLRADIETRYAAYDPIVVALSEVTNGQLATVLEAAEHFVDGPLVIYNADTLCHPRLEETLAANNGDIDGVIGVFRAEGDHWSFADVGGDGLVRATAEKRRISDWATTGLYHFSDVLRFLTLARAMVARDDRTQSEFYVAPLYNDLIAQGGRVVVDVAQDVSPLGTPDELAEYLATQR